MKDTLLTTKEAAAYIKHSEVTLEQWRLSGKGPKFYKPENKVLYYVSDLDEWVKGEKNA